MKVEYNPHSNNHHNIYCHNLHQPSDDHGGDSGLLVGGAVVGGGEECGSSEP